MKLHPPAGEITHWLPCQKCLGCREQTQQLLAIRLIHEARSYQAKTFLTLTYDDEHEPNGLSKRDLQLFWKRLRKHNGAKLKYLACGEYGDRTKRPHYHAAVLGLHITDGKKWDAENHRSPTLENLWQKGIVTNSDLTEDRARYVAGYVLKKSGYRRQTYCDEDGVELEPPFRVLSQGLGKKWLEKYAEDLRHGYLQHDGAKYTIPRYYQDIIKQKNPQLNERIEKQKLQDRLKRENPDQDRLHAAEIIRQKTIRERKRTAI